MFRFTLFSIAVVLGFFACSKTPIPLPSMSFQGGRPLGAGQTPRLPAGPVVDLKESFDLQNALRSTRTKLNLSQTEFATLNSLLPATFRVVSEGLVGIDQLASARVNEVDLIRMTLVAESFTRSAVGQPSLQFSHEFAVKSILAPDTQFQFYRVTVDGLSVAGQLVSYLYLLLNGDLQLGLADGSEVALQIAGIQELLSTGTGMSEWILPTGPVLVKGLFSLANSIRENPAPNQLHLLGKLLTSENQSLLDASGRAAPDLENPLRKLMRAKFATLGMPEQFLLVVDRITDVWVDRDGIKIWLSEPASIGFSEGQMSFASRFSLASTGPETIVPLAGLLVTADGADGAELQQLRYNGDAAAGQIDVAVYGYRNTFLGTFGDSKILSYPLAN